MNRRTFLKSIGVIGSAFVMGGCTERFASKPKARSGPNIVFILADDMGIDSVSALNSKSGIETPCLNKLMTEGMTFTDAHSGSAVCSPTRYGVLTGRYSWRTRLKQGIVAKWKRPLIDENRLTVGKMLQPVERLQLALPMRQIESGDAERGRNVFEQPPPGLHATPERTRRWRS